MSIQTSDSALADAQAPYVLTGQTLDYRGAKVSYSSGFVWWDDYNLVTASGVDFSQGDFSDAGNITCNGVTVFWGLGNLLPWGVYHGALSFIGCGLTNIDGFVSSLNSSIYGGNINVSNNPVAGGSLGVGISPSQWGTYYSISNCGLTACPSLSTNGYGAMTVDLSHNQITSCSSTWDIGTAFGCGLNLSYNLLTSCPAFAGSSGASALSLDVSHNRIASLSTVSIPSGVTGFYIILASNLITTCPTPVFYSPNDAYSCTLDLSNNLFTSIDLSGLEMHNGSILICGNPALTTIVNPGSIGSIADSTLSLAGSALDNTNENNLLSALQTLQSGWGIVFTLDISGGTNAVPDGTGSSIISVLTGAGCTIITN